MPSSGCTLRPSIPLRVMTPGSPRIVNYFYYDIWAKFPAPIPSSPGKNVGWTDWTHAGKPRSTSSGWLERSYTAVADSCVRGGADVSKS